MYVVVIRIFRIHFRYAFRDCFQSSQCEVASHVEECLRHEWGKGLLYEAVDGIKDIVHVCKIKALVKLLS